MINLSLGAGLIILGALTGLWWLPVSLYAALAAYLGIKASNSLREVPGNIWRGFLFIVAPFIYDNGG